MVDYSPADHAEAHGALLERILGSNEGEKRWLDSLEGIVRPLDRPLAAGERRIKVGSYETIPEGRSLYKHAGSMVADDSNGYPARDWRWQLVQLDGALIGPKFTYQMDDQAFVEDFRGITYQWRKYGHPPGIARIVDFISYDPASDTAVTALNPTVTLGEETPVFIFLGDLSSVNFAHFLHDSMFQLMAYDKACEIAGQRLQPVFTKSHKGSFRYPMMEFMVRTLLKWDGPVLFLENASAGARIVRGFTSTINANAAAKAVSYDALAHLRARVAECYSGPRYQRDRRPIWVSRRDGMSGRILENEAQGEAVAVAHGYDSVTVSSLAPEEIAATFRNATALAGIHGAGMMNFIFADSGSQYLECLFPTGMWDLIPICASAAGFKVARLKPMEGPSLHVGRINLNELDEALRNGPRIA